MGNEGIYAFVVIMKLKRQSLVPPGTVSRMLQAAEQAWQVRDFQQCVETLERASRLAPSNTDVLLQLGRVYGLRYNYAAAERCFERALRFAPRKTEMLKAVVNHCNSFHNPDVIERYLRLMVDQSDCVPETLIQLAELYERLHRLPIATQLVEQALKLNPADPAALLVRARMERQAGRLETAEQVLRAFITRPNLDTWVHAQAWYELGNVLDRQKRFDEAMSAFLKAKTLMRPQADKHLADLKVLRARLRVMEANVSSELFKRWFDARSELAPTRRLALLCGHARSGTTLLEQVLDAHPDIVSVEETNNFVDDAYAPLTRSLPPDAYMLPVLEAASIQALQQARTTYFRSMELAIGTPIAGRLLVDKNPDHTFLIPAFIRIFPETKFLVTMRDPRDVVLSCFMQPQQLNAVKAAFLSLEGTAENYAGAMSIWQTLAPLMPSPYLEIRYEDMVDDLESVARKTLDFLGVAWDAKVLGFDEHARKRMVRSPSYADVTQPLYKRARGRWRNYQKYLEPHLPKLAPFIKAFGYD